MSLVTVTPLGVEEVIVCWGTPGAKGPRADQVLKLLRKKGHKVCCLGENRDGSPKHPLYLRRDACRTPYGGS